MRERKPIDAELRSFLDAQAAAAGAPAPTSNEELLRLRRALLVRALENRPSIPGLPNVVEARDVAISGMLTGRLYTPPRGLRDVASPGVFTWRRLGGWLGCNARPVLPPPERGGPCDHRFG